MMASMTEKVLLVSRRWGHHASHSGYDILGDHLAQTLSTRPIPQTLLPDSIFWRATVDMQGYDRTAAALELKTAAHMATHRRWLYHLLYADNTFHYLGKLSGWRGHRVVASFHLPPHGLAAWIRTPEKLRQLSAVIMLGSTQLSFFEGILPEERLFLVPYAVNTAYFRPPALYAEREENLCLFVGSHLRDLDTLVAVVENAYRLAPHIKFVAVAHPKDRARFSGIVGNFNLQSNLSELELLRLYQKAALVIQPLQDTVANTALLETMACGTPIVVTDIGAVREYVAEDCARFVAPYSPQAMLEAIVDLIADPETRSHMATKARERAMLFDWQRIAGQMRDTYQRILELD
jgi:glycosyltransferase involved in cell wall biosynthesis